MPCMEVHSEAEIHLQPMEGHNWRRWTCLEVSFDLTDSLHWNRLLPGAHWKPRLEQVCWQDLRSPGESTLEQLVKN